MALSRFMVSVTKAHDNRSNLRCRTTTKRHCYFSTVAQDHLVLFRGRRHRLNLHWKLNEQEETNVSFVERATEKYLADGLDIGFGGVGSPWRAYRYTKRIH